MKKRKYQICSNCVMDTSDSQIKFDERGFCDHCNNYYNNILPNWQQNDLGKKKLEVITNKIKEAGRNKKYDCIIGLSGGVDSSYLTYIAKEKLGLRPLIFSVVTGWNLDVANKNVERIIKGLNLDLYTEIVNWDEMKDLQYAFFKAQVAYQDIPQDHVIFASLYNYAVKSGIKYILTGANYSTECIREPSEWVYQNDLRLMKDIHLKFGKRPLATLPLCNMFKYKLYYRYIKGIKVVQPLNLIPYKKEEAIEELQSKFNWEKYENKHYESILTRFYEGYWMIKKFGYDKRRAYLSSLILTGQISRKEALDILSRSPYDENIAMQDLEYVSNKLDMTKDEFIELMNGENKTYRNYKSNSFLIETAVKLAQLLGVEKRNFR